MKKATVYIRRLDAPHRQESLTEFQPLNPALKKQELLTEKPLRRAKL